MEKSKKSDGLQAVIQLGQIGFYPFNRLSVSALAHHHISAIIDTADLSQTAVWKTQSEWNGRVFPGFSDAFYRGKLPEVILVTSPMVEMPFWIESFMDFLEKLCVLGFFSQDAQDEIGVLDRYAPQIVIGSYGTLFDVAQEKLSRYLDNLSAMSSRQKERMLQKISRAFFTSPPYTLPEETGLSPYPDPMALTLTGLKSSYTLRANELLEAHGIKVNFNPNGETGIYELELNLAYQHLSRNLTPPFPGNLAESMEKLGQNLGILPGLVTQTQSLFLAKDQKSVPPTMLDLAILHQLTGYARKTNMNEFAQQIQAWITLVQPLVEKTSLQTI